MFQSSRESTPIATSPYSSHPFDLREDICLITLSLPPIKRRYDVIIVDKEKAKNIEGKLKKAYPDIFLAKLKERGRYFPLPIPPQTDEQIRMQIVGDSTMTLEDEMRLVEAIELQDGETVLDLGAGFGRTSFLLAEQADIRVLSLDADEEKTELLQNVLQNYHFNDGKSGSEKITPIVGNETNLKQIISYNGKVDVVVIKNVIGLLSQLVDPVINQIDRLTEERRCIVLAEKLQIFTSKVKEVLKEGGKVVIWDGDLTTDYLLETLVTGMYLEGFKEKENASLIKFQFRKPPKEGQASFGVFFYEPNDESLSLFRRVYS